MARRGKAAASFSSSTLELVQAKLAESGLGLEDIPAFGFQPLDGPEAQRQLGVDPRAGLLLPYHDPTTGDPTGFWRYRYLDLGTGFASLVKKPTRYVQPAATVPRAYFPRGLPWPDILEDTSHALLITEGELKACSAAKLLPKHPTIGLGGVWSWKSKRHGVPFIQDLDLPRWLGRRVYLCFDSDYRQNPDVLRALIELAEELGHRGAIVLLLSLPDPRDGQKKVGLDDFLAEAGPDHLEGLIEQADHLGYVRDLLEINKAYAYVREHGFVVSLKTRRPIPVSTFTGHLFANRTAYQTRLTIGGDVVQERMEAGRAWISWPMRREATTLTFKPGQSTQLPTGELNTWQGWGCEPRAGDVSPFLRLVDHLFTGADPGSKEWFLRWCAYPLQYPGAKLSSAVVLYGIKHGTGKTLLGQTLARLYGQHAVEISHRDLEGSFNEWQVNRQFVVGDDITGADKRQDADYLKKLITQAQVTINQKFLPTYVMPDCMNYFFTSNHPDAFFLEDDDRRLFVHEVSVSQLSEDFYADYALWLETEGAPAVFYHLLHLGLGDFNPAGRACQTRAKARMIDDGRSDLASWVRRLASDPDEVLKTGRAKLTKDLHTSMELLALYGDHTGRVTATGLGRELARAGFQQVLAGKPLRVTGRPQARYYICRHPERWLTATSSQVLKHLSER